MRLVYKSNPDHEVQVGDIHKRDDEVLTVDSIEKPKHGGSTGRVYVKRTDGSVQGYYPSIIGAEWIEREDQHGW